MPDKQSHSQAKDHYRKTVPQEEERKVKIVDVVMKLDVVKQKYMGSTTIPGF